MDLISKVYALTKKHISEERAHFDTVSWNYNLQTERVYMQLCDAYDRQERANAKVKALRDELITLINENRANKN